MDMDSSPLIQPDNSDLSKKRVDEVISLSPDSGEVTDTDPLKGSSIAAEKPSKVQKTAGLFGVFSNLATGLSSASQSVLEQAKGASKIVQKSLGDHTIIGGFNRMQNEFIQEKQARQKGPGSAPWIGEKNEDELRRQILNLSGDKRNFMRDPPTGAGFEYDAEASMPVAQILLQMDPDLEKRRFELVPKVLTESAFWRNYFYRISLIKQSSMLTSDSPDLDNNTSRLKPKSDIDRDDISVASNLDLMDGSVVGDSDTHAEEHQVVMPCEPPVLKPSAKGSASSIAATKGSEDGWERELQQTLDSYEVVGGDVADTEVDQALASSDD